MYKQYFKFDHSLYSDFLKLIIRSRVRCFFQNQSIIRSIQLFSNTYRDLELKVLSKMPAEFRGLKSGEGDDAPDVGSARPADSARIGGSAQHGSLTRPYSQPQLSFPQANKQNCLNEKYL